VHVVVPDDGGRVERGGEAEEGAAAVGHGAAPPPAGACRADEPERGVEAEEDQPEKVVLDVVDAPRLLLRRRLNPARLPPVLPLHCG